MQVGAPQYVGTRFDEAPPGHRYRLYFSGWEDDWSLPRKGKDKMAAGATSLPSQSTTMRSALLKRQESLVDALGESALSISTLSEAPFVTGMGIEHLLENGFAFFDPYGLPYLPGSSVKGVLRRAAEELALFEENSSWNMAAVWCLFGFDANSAFMKKDPPNRKDTEVAKKEREYWRKKYREHINELKDENLEWMRGACAELLKKYGVGLKELLRDKIPGTSDANKIHCRGALDCWDVFPVSSTLRVDIMNPHFPDYYMKGKLPTDNQNPNPIFYLTLPAQTEFAFNLVFAPTEAISKILGERWRDLIIAALEHAFRWLGFGAKTAIGYGRMARGQNADEKRAEQNKPRAIERRRHEEEQSLRAAKETR